MVDRIRWDTVSYLPFYYVFFQFLLLTIFSFTSQNIDDKGHTLKPGIRQLVLHCLDNYRMIN